MSDSISDSQYTARYYKFCFVFSFPARLEKQLIVPKILTFMIFEKSAKQSWKKWTRQTEDPNAPEHFQERKVPIKQYLFSRLFPQALCSRLRSSEQSAVIKNPALLKAVLKQSHDIL